MNLLTEHLATWIAADTFEKSGRGRSGDSSLYGVKKLRELILELAVRGLLVPQDAADEPASELLKKIAAEKAKLVKEGKIKAQKPLPPIGDDEKPFDLPSKTNWVRLNTISHILGDGLHGTPKYTDSSEYFFINGNNLDNGQIVIKPNTRMVLKEEYEAHKKNLTERTVLVSINGTLGNVAFYNNEKVILGKSACYFNLCYQVDKFYLKLVLESPYFLKYAEKYATGSTIKNLSLKSMNELPIPLPPLPEQQRIVSKVDELMAFCDQLEQKQHQSQAAHQQLVSQLLNSLTQSQSITDFSQYWQRINTHFDSLFTTENSIEALKQSILQLAVMGKLVAQNPTDEPASELLKKIAAEKAKLVKEGKIKAQKPLPPIGDDEKPFDLPMGWEWVRLEALTEIITKGSSPKWQGVQYTDNPDDVLFVTSENVGSNELKLTEKKYVEKKFNDIEPRSILKNGDFLMNIVGASIGRVAIFNLETIANINQAVCLIRCLDGINDSQYLVQFFNSEFCKSYMFDKQVDNARANLSMGNISLFLIPLPPLAEQHRIVAKVDELMALCNQLKAQINQAKHLQGKIADVLVEQALA